MARPSSPPVAQPLAGLIRTSLPNPRPTPFSTPPAAGGGTVNWCAPETILGQPCTVQSDMFSYGVVLWELATGEAPVRGSMRPVR